VGQIKLLSATLVVTMLIWTTAHQLNSATLEDYPLTVKLIPADQDRMIIKTVPAGAETFRVTLTGPKRIVDQVRADGLPTIKIPVPNEAEGMLNIDLRADCPADRNSFAACMSTRLRWSR